MTASAIPRFSLIRAPNECLAEPNERSLDFERIRCPVKPGHARGRRIYPLDVVIPCNPAPDVIFTWMSECLIQASVRDIFKSEGLTGFSTLPASATIRKTGASVPVSELSIVGWGGMAPASSDIREIERCLACGHLHYSGVLNPERLLVWKTGMAQTFLWFGRYLDFASSLKGSLRSAGVTELQG